ncbi:MAG: PASTA domain-containing protein [Prevotella sp.]|nr:PASTA domain-containing protein [Prevotella sp.]MBR0263462.1 PASTA domain-containing protein [Prevotella sp.]
MKTKEFFGKFCSKFLIGNLLAMLLVVIALMFGMHYGLSWYTHHGEGIQVPNLERKSYGDARMMIEELKLNIIVSDSGYNKRLPADCVLAQNPGPGTYVKEGHTIYVTVNSPSSPSFPIPDVVDNSSYREAEAKLMAIGFKLLPPQYVMGEKDWVYGILCRGRRVSTGDMVSIEAPLTLMIGNGQYDAGEEIDYVEPEYRMMESGHIDEFEEVTE